MVFGVCTNKNGFKTHKSKRQPFDYETAHFQLAVKNLLKNDNATWSVKASNIK